MGVKGFTTYMSKNAHLFHEYYELRNCYVVLDGSGIAINLYMWHTKSNDCYGGDYDNYANTVYRFFRLLKQCDITPIILFDGGYENRKFKTVFGRMRNRIHSIRKLNGSRSDPKVYPIFTKEIFQDIALSLGVKCIRNDHESDSEVACLGRYLNCPIIGYDSDFYFFDTLYIPFKNFPLQSKSYFNEQSKRYEHFIPCEVYNMDYFLDHFGGLDKTNLPLLPVLLGNDYVKKSLFSAFYKHIKVKKSKVDNEQQRLIKTVINWLRHETLKSAISKILGRFKAKKRRLVYFRLKSAMKGYLQISSTITEYLDDLNIPLQEEKYDIDILNIEPTFKDDEGDLDSTSNDESDISDQEVSESNVTEDEEDTESVDFEENEIVTVEDSLFTERYRQCLLPQCFADIKWKNIYFGIPLIENYDHPNSHSISSDILVSLHKILSPCTTAPLSCIWRTKGTKLRKDKQDILNENLANLVDIQKFDESERKCFLFKILNIDDSYQQLLELFPPSWHLFLISLYYWKKKTVNVIDTSYIYSLFICAIVLNFDDTKIGFCRSSKAFDRKFKINKIDPLDSKPILSSEKIKDCLKKISSNESLLCLKTLLNFFNKLPKKPIDKKLDDSSIVGYFSEFQSCALHIKYLNSILNFPFENLMIWKFFCGTFLYNTVVDFRRRSNLKAYLETLFKDCKNVMAILEIIMKNVEQYIGEICESDAKKRRKRKKRSNKNEEEELDYIET